MAVIAVGGFQHETNTFAPSKADYATFVQGGAWPPLTEGEAIAARLGGANIPAAGALAALHAAGQRTTGLVWAAASPTAHVTEDAFERIVGTLTQRLAQAGPVDGVYLDLHGAMVTEHLDDGDGEILARVRCVVGPRVPIVASLDLHANVTQRMLSLADGMVAYRTYPHVDMKATGERAAHLLLALRERDTPLAHALRPLDFLTSLSAQSTWIEPGRRLYDLLAAIEREEDTVLSFTPGFPLADFPECQMAVLGYGADAARVARAVERLAHAVADAEPEFVVDLHAPDEAVARADAHGAVGAPVVLADTQDNPGAGGNGDTTGLLAALIAANPPGAVLGLLIDRASAAQAHALGVGREARFHLGETSGLPGHVPLAGEFEVQALADGNFTCTGPMFEGFAMTLGPMAVLAHGNVRVVLASKKVQAADQAMFRHVGIEPGRQRILALKSSAHFRADFAPLAREILIVAAPGPAPADPAALPFRRLRPGLRLRPLGPAFVPPRTEP
ncbi:MAG: M81 family metallopeptidase [Burkholderiales bacterium]|nr:M81 family metallopeptidase [Burkholderiales bacterium]